MDGRSARFSKPADLGRKKSRRCIAATSWLFIMIRFLRIGLVRIGPVRIGLLGIGRKIGWIFKLLAEHFQLFAALALAGRTAFAFGIAPFFAGRLPAF